MRRVAGWTAYWVLFGVAIVAVLGSVGAELASFRIYSVPSDSMDNTVQPNDQILLVKGTDVRRGDVVVFAQQGPGDEASLVKRVIGLPGDHVACCGSLGRVTVDGKTLTESYLYQGEPPSIIHFSVTLGSGQVWVMGDRRDISRDSRELGPVQMSAITGRVAVVIHGGHSTWLHTPAAFTSAGLAPADTRTIEWWPLVIAGACVVLILALGALGIVWLARRRRAPAPAPH
jgi:signal peptidase I